MNINSYGLQLEHFVKTLEVALLFEIDEATHSTGVATLPRNSHLLKFPSSSLSVLTGLLDQLEAQELATQQDAELQYAEYAEYAEYAKYADYE